MRSGVRWGSVRVAFTGHADREAGTGKLGTRQGRQGSADRARGWVSDDLTK